MYTAAEVANFIESRCHPKKRYTFRWNIPPRSSKLTREWIQCSWDKDAEYQIFKSGEGHLLIMIFRFRNGSDSAKLVRLPRDT